MNGIALNLPFAKHLLSNSRKVSVIDIYGQLFPIAQQCPSSGGEAVFRAREIIRQVNDSLEYVDASVCAQLGIYRKKQFSSGIKQAIHLLLIPNPTKDQVQLILSGFNTYKEITVTIHDLIGRILDQKTIKTKLTSIVLNSSSLSNGIYVVEVSTDQHEWSSTKLIIGK